MEKIFEKLHIPSSTFEQIYQRVASNLLNIFEWDCLFNMLQGYLCEVPLKIIKFKYGDQGATDSF
jgi:hypothetical protein